jgi:hypothetical protein
MATHKISQFHFKSFFGIKKLDKNFITLVKKSNLKYSLLKNYELKLKLKKISEFINSNKIIKSGKEYKKRWEEGWSHNFNIFKKNQFEKALIPKYFNKYPFARLNGHLIKTHTNLFDYKILKLLTSYLFMTYFKRIEQAIEFGCGTGHNLLNLRKYNKNAELIGLDWTIASQKILKKISLIFPKFFGYNFDFFSPKINFKVKKKSIFFSIAALEQIGARHKKFLNFVLHNKPALVIHLEPIPELLDKKNILDNLSIQFMEKKNYLKNYLVALKSLEKSKRIKIIKIRKSYFGSLYINGYSLIVWKVL